MDVDLNNPPPEDLDGEFEHMDSEPTGRANDVDGEPTQQPTGEATNVPGASNQTHTGQAHTDHTNETGAATGVTISSEDSGGDDEVQSTPETLIPETPYVGMKFDTWESALMHYNRYAKHIGFSVKMRSSRKSVLKDKQLFVCNKSGKNSEKEGEAPPVRVRNRTITKLYDCKAKIRVKRIGARWEVTQFVGEHTHELIEKFALKKYLRYHKKIPAEERDFIDLLRLVNLSAGRIMEIMSELYGSRKNVPYDTKKISNYTTQHNELYRHMDIPYLLEYFEELKKNDPQFFYKFKLDAGNRVENIYWVDGAARELYKQYNECISIDTTYMTNLYKMPCAPFIGINRYGQSIQFGCGFLRNEKIPNFVWLFETFLEAMDGLAPLNMITDQDAAMRSAMLIVLPNTVHRNCRWHIMQKFQEKVGPFVAKREDLRREFNEIVDYSLTVEEFGTAWAGMIERHNLSENSNSADISDIRAAFVPAYFKDRFFPFLQTTARSEGFNAVLKKYVNPHDSLLRFFKQYMKLQEKIEVAEDALEFEGDEKTLRVWSDYPMEEQMLGTYTLPIYKKFQVELRKITSYNIRHCGGELYEVSPIRGSVFGYGKRNYMVKANLAEQEYNCECCKFSKDGVLCCHAMKVMTYVGLVESMPERYILRRWCVPPPDIEMPQNQPQPEPEVKLSRKEMRLLRYGNLCNHFSKLAVGFAASEKTKEIAERHMRAMEVELSAMKKADAAALKKKKKKEVPVQEQTTGADGGQRNNPSSGHVHEDNATSSSGATGRMNQAARDPPYTVTKGRPCEKRKKFGLQLKPTQKVPCKVCGSK